MTVLEILGLGQGFFLYKTSLLLKYNPNYTLICNVLANAPVVTRPQGFRITIIRSNKCPTSFTLNLASIKFPLLLFLRKVFVNCLPFSESYATNSVSISASAQTKFQVDITLHTPPFFRPNNKSDIVALLRLWWTFSWLQQSSGNALRTSLVRCWKTFIKFRWHWSLRCWWWWKRIIQW